MAQSKKDRLQDRKRAYERRIKRHPEGSKKRKRAKAYLKGIIERLKSLNQKLRRRRKRERREKRQLGRGAWEGTQSFFDLVLDDVAREWGIAGGSEKRWATYGNPGSDHYMGVTNAYAKDYRTGSNRAFAQALKDALCKAVGQESSPVVDYGSFYIRASGRVFRVQIIYSTHGTGPHNHTGIKRV